MREELMVALRRDSAELEREMIEQRIDAAFERVYEDMLPAADYLRATLDPQGLRAFKQYEAAMQRALEYAARSGVGCTGKRRLELGENSRRAIPVVMPPVEALPAPLPTAEPDQVLRVGFRG